MVTVDANVWIAAFDPTDAFYADSVAFLAEMDKRRTPLHAPAFLVVEAACALARRLNDPSAGLAAATKIQQHPALRLEPLSAALLARATRLGTDCLLRGADALYAATAAMTTSTLVSWDAELVMRAGAQTPAQWLLAPAT